MANGTGRLAITLLRLAICALFLTPFPSAASTTLTLAHIYAPDHPTAKACELFAARVEKESSGRIVVKVFDDSSMGNQTPIIRSLKNGSLDFSVLSQGVVGTIVPEFNAFGLPYLFPDTDTAWRILDGEIGQKLKQKAGDSGFIVLSFWNIDVRHFSNSKHPIRTPADMVGLRIRTPPDRMTADVILALGARPVAINFSNLYRALQQGVVDGQDNPLINFRSMRFDEVQKYLSLTGHKYSIYSFLMSRLSWESLSGADREIIQRAANDALRYYRELTRDSEADVLRELQARGVLIEKIDPQSFKTATEVVYDKWYSGSAGGFVRSVVQAVRGKE